MGSDTTQRQPQVNASERGQAADNGDQQPQQPDNPDHDYARDRQGNHTDQNIADEASRDNPYGYDNE